MPRVKRGVTAKARHKKVLKAAKGYYGARSRNFRTATQAVDKANQYATRDRKNRKRNFRALWIQRINAGVRANSETMTYSRFMNGLSKAGIEVDRKVLADIAVHDMDSFKALVDQAAQAKGVSKSRWVAELIRTHARKEWPEAFLSAAGSIPDFPLLERDGAAGLPPDAPRIGF